MSKVQRLTALVEERLTAVVEDIYVLFERIIAEYEEELCRSKQENERNQRLLESTLSPQSPRVVLTRAGVHMSSLSPGLSQKQEIPETPQIKEEPEEQHVKQEEEELQVSVPDGCVKTEESSLLQKKETDHREDISSQTHVHREDTQGKDIGSQTHVHLKTEEDTEHSSDTNSDEDWSAPIGSSAAEMETDADGDHYSQVQIRAKSTTAPNSSLSPKYKSAPETRATVDNGDVSGTAEGTVEKKHQCSVCKKRFGLKIGLITHFRIHTGEKPYSCSVCEKAFNQKSHFTKHMRIHTGDKPYRCSLCEKAFTQKYNLTYHIRTHTGEKPYRCSLCEKAFIEKYGLTLHMRTHTGEKPYRCSFCEKAFTAKAYLIKHEMKHTGDKPYR
ncbi:zinc finger and SCAN domain-containing protein 2-like [Periophthalmus magnuspinnatus]|uniref:zinc finger and SCAN domain-containing protein 2-like n=1 Tax=Periophthalmus magnuspinnatus TaxID=409849 RepID=UPI002436A145|nr:zinc finger and SCAN domain-containing protein 2-like [Periophthalmus magnuspinnatus]